MAWGAGSIPAQSLESLVNSNGSMATTLSPKIKRIQNDCSKMAPKNTILAQ